MEYFTKLNAKLDLGWKITDASCEQCKKTLVYNPIKNEFFCVMCEKIAELTIEPLQKSSSKVVEKIKSIGSSENSAEKPREEDFSLYPKFVKKEKNDLSSKLAQKLLEGYAMLEECCPDCLVPMMRPKNGIAVCVGCDYKWDVSEKKEKKIIKEEKEEKIVEPSFEKKIEKNLDKPRPLLKKEKSNEKNFDEKLEKTKENLSEILLNLSKLYLSETETMINSKNIHGIEYFMEGPMKNLMKFYNQLKK